jgi:hypothetical protein
MADKKAKKMDEATVRKLLGLLPINNDFTVTYVPEAFKDIDKEYQPTFILKPFNSKEIKEIALKMQEAVDNDYVLSQIKTKIVGWSNYINLSTQELIVYSDEEVNNIPLKVINDLSTEILKLSGIGA